MKQAQPTFAAHLNELLGAALLPAQLDSGGALLSILRGSLERARVGLPTG